MEDDNAQDIIKWIFKDTTKCNFQGILGVKIGENVVTCEIKLKGNLLAIKPQHAPIEPMLVVMERVSLEKSETDENSFYLIYSSGKIKFTANNSKEVEDWIVKLVVCTHQMAQAECDQSAYKFYNLPSPNDVKQIQNNGSTTQIFLANPSMKCHSFAISQTRHLPARKIIVEESMYESKLCFIMATELLNLFKKWNSEALEEMNSRMKYFSSTIMQESVRNAMRYMNENDESYARVLESISVYNKGFYKSSVDKNRIDLAAAPVNLHVQYFVVENENIGFFITHGAPTAYPLKYDKGGLGRIKNTFAEMLDSPIAIDHTMENRYYYRKRDLLSMKKQIGELYQQIDMKWDKETYEDATKFALKTLGDIKRIHESLLDIINSFPDLSNLIDSLYEFSKRRDSLYGTTNSINKKTNIPFLIGDTLTNQLDNIDAQIISLNTKVDAMDKLKDTVENQKVSKDMTKLSLNSSLDVLLHLSQSILQAQLYSLLYALNKAPISQAYYQLQLRSDFVFSQAVTILTTAILTKIERCQTSKEINFWDNYPPIITFFGFLSCYGDEKGMMEDFKDICNGLNEKVVFKFIYHTSSIRTNVIPIISGDRGQITITLSMPDELMEKLPPNLQKGGLLRPCVVYWNLGINHEASFSSLWFNKENNYEEYINSSAYQSVHNYFVGYPNKNERVESLIKKLELEVKTSPSNKNVSLFKTVMSLTSALNGVNCISCKSGKDRTSMAVTLEEGRLLKETCGVNDDQVSEMIVCLRRDGVRRENCRKNVGKPMYSFSSFQMHFLPPEFRPPTGTFTHGVSS
uniref:PH domain-containing protein n=1 Tax=Parastrongyloides trichosuri TaxID=131310 RepID=A0A0N4ZXE9_PARTI